MIGRRFSLSNAQSVFLVHRDLEDVALTLRYEDEPACDEDPTDVSSADALTKVRGPASTSPTKYFAIKFGLPTKLTPTPQELNRDNVSQPYTVRSSIFCEGFVIPLLHLRVFVPFIPKSFAL
jgi:hypothetical protein